ncbi:Uma2 family endonuclease [Actinoplanes sp. NPDC023936]|uniref:Uma2 family endonuclease n=1 Tax=Actinoplanes sp. NPDC023936 TaxID=3154910 RepID=UPI0033FB4DE1
MVTEAEFLALGETRERIELFDGTLHLAPALTPRHQHFTSALVAALVSATPHTGIQVLRAVNVRVGPDRIAIPDLVVTEEIDLDELVVDASAVRLVCEILSPSNGDTDKVLKRHYYATAGIPWYLLGDPVTGTLRLFALDGSAYSEVQVATPGTPLRLTEPVAVTIDPGQLLPPR